MPNRPTHALDPNAVAGVSGRTADGPSPLTLYDLVPRFVRRLPNRPAGALLILNAVIESCGSGFETAATRAQLQSLMGGPERGTSPASITRAIKWLIENDVIVAIPDLSTSAGRRLRLLWKRTAKGIRRIAPRRKADVQLTLNFAPPPLIKNDQPPHQECPPPSSIPHTVEKHASACAGAFPREPRENTVTFAPEKPPQRPPDRTARHDLASPPGPKAPEAQPGSSADVEHWLRIAAIPGHPRAATARAMLRSIQAPEDLERDPDPPPARPNAGPSPVPIRAAPNAASYTPGNPTARCNAPECTLERALALTGKLSLPGAVDAILDVLAKRWRDPKDLTRRKWRGYIETLDPAILADLITSADARHVNRPAHYFSRIAAQAVHGGSNPLRGA